MTAVLIIVSDLVLTGLFLASSPTGFFRRYWQDALFVWCSALALSASAIVTITHQSDVFLVSLVILLLGTAAVAPWGARWQTFFILICMGAAFVCALFGTPRPDTYEAYRLVELGTAAVMSLFVATLTDRHSNETLRIEQAVAGARDSPNLPYARKANFCPPCHTKFVRR